MTVEQIPTKSPASIPFSPPAVPVTSSGRPPGDNLADADRRDRRERSDTLTCWPRIFPGL